MKEEWLFPNAVVPVDTPTTLALLVEIKRLIDVVGGMALAQPDHSEQVLDMVAQQDAEALARTVMLDQTSHDTRREWVGLVDEERDAITDKVIGFNSCCGWEDDYAKAIEAKIKEKNT